MAKAWQVTPWQKLLRAKEQHRGIHLSQKDVGVLIRDYSICERAELDDQEQEELEFTDHDDQLQPCDRHGDTNCGICVESGCDY